MPKNETAQWVIGSAVTIGLIVANIGVAPIVVPIYMWIGAIAGYSVARMVYFK